MVLAFQTEFELYEEFTKRRKKLISVMADERKALNVYIATAKFATDKDKKRGLEYIDSLITSPKGDMFFTYPLIGFYLHSRGFLPERMKQKIKNTFINYTAYRGDTENHWVMYYTALYLASQTWPDIDGDSWYTGKSSNKNLKEAEEWLNHWIKLTTTIGQGEFDSPHYGSCFLGPMFLLYDFAKDHNMRKKAGMMIDLLLADYAVEYLKGIFTGGHSRIIRSQVYNHFNNPMHSLGYLYFGDTEFPSRRDMVIFSCLSSYRLPYIIYRIATDRKNPFINRETKRVRNIIRIGKERNPPVYKYDYITKNYCLGSLQGGILQPIQQHTWDLSYVSEHPNGTIFSLHPYYSSVELAMFFPEEIKIMVDEVSKSKTIYTDENKWVSSSPFEQTFQHKNTIIVLYNIKDGEWPRHIDSFFPKSLDQIEREQNGWIFCRDGKIFVAYYPIKPYRWIEEKINYRLSSYFQKNGLIMEVANSDEYPSFVDFKNKIKSNKLDVKNFDKELKVIYTTSNGDVMEFKYDGLRKINGSAVKFENYQLFNSPFIFSKYK
ncbi:hypothetical protein DRQ09_07185, partial [candidate division KSB1 bacterium]